MARTSFVNELAEIGKSGVKEMTWQNRGPGDWHIQMQYSCKCKGSIDLKSLGGSDATDRTVYDAMRLASSCGKHQGGASATTAS